MKQRGSRQDEHNAKTQWRQTLSARKPCGVRRPGAHSSAHANARKGADGNSSSPGEHHTSSEQHKQHKARAKLHRAGPGPRKQGTLRQCKALNPESILDRGRGGRACDLVLCGWIAAMAGCILAGNACCCFCLCRRCPLLLLLLLPLVLPAAAAHCYWSCRFHSKPKHALPLRDLRSDRTTLSSFHFSSGQCCASGRSLFRLSQRGAFSMCLTVSYTCGAHVNRKQQGGDDGVV